MTISYKVKLVDADNKPASNYLVRAYVLNVSTGGWTSRGYARTDANGQVTIKDTTIETGDYLPHVILKVYVDRKYQTLDQAPVSTKATEIDFGTQTLPSSTLEINPALISSLSRTDSVAALSAVDVSSLNTRISTLESEKSELSKQLNTANTSKANLQTQLTAKTTDYANLQKTYSAQSKELTQVTKELNTAKANSDANALKVTALQTEKNDLTKQLNDQAISFNQQKSALVKTHQSALTKKDDEINRLKADVAELTENQGADVSMQDLVTRVSSNIESANTRLSESKSAFKLGNVSMKIKALPGQSGNGLSFIDKDKLGDVNGDVLSEITLDFAPNTAANTEPQAITVPDLIGYTQALATRKLREAGFKVDVEYTSVIDVEGQASDHGKVVSQVPSQLSQSSPGSLVTIAVGKRTQIRTA